MSDTVKETARVYGRAETPAELPRPYSYEEYLQLPEGAAYQLVGGMLVMSPGPSAKHQDICHNLLIMFRTYAKKQNLGLVYEAPLDVYFSDTEVYQPDLLFISKERLDIRQQQRVCGAPDLVVEVLSPANAYYDLWHKFRVYEQYRVKEYWLVDPESEIVKVYTLQTGKLVCRQDVPKDGTVFSEVLAGFSAPAVEIYWTMESMQSE